MKLHDLNKRTMLHLVCCGTSLHCAAHVDASCFCLCLLQQGHRNWVLCVAWSPDGALVASGDMDGNIWLWDPATGKPLGTCKGHSKWITSLVRSNCFPSYGMP